jgi:hypothetical protein
LFLPDLPFHSIPFETMSPKKLLSQSSGKRSAQTDSSNNPPNSTSNQSKQMTSVLPSDFPKQFREYWERLDWGTCSIVNQKHKEK